MSRVVRRSRKQFRVPVVGEGLQAQSVVGLRRWGRCPQLSERFAGRGYRGGFLHTGEVPVVVPGVVRRRVVRSPSWEPARGRVWRAARDRGPLSSLGRRLDFWASVHTELELEASVHTELELEASVHTELELSASGEG